MALGPSDNEIKKYNEEKERIRIASREKLDETIKSLNKAKRKFKLKTCGVFACYTLPTALYITAAIVCSSIGSKLIGTKTYEHTTYYYANNEYPNRAEPNVYYSINKEDESPKLIVKEPWFKSPTGDNYDRHVYTYDLAAFDIDSILEWFQHADFNNIQEIINLLPDPHKSLESDFDESIDSLDDYEIYISIDKVNINKKITHNSFGDKLIFYINFLLIYIIRRQYKSSDENFPMPLINALERLSNSDDLKNIQELQEEIESIKLTLSK